jgi:hypothetical protein
MIMSSRSHTADEPLDLVNQSKLSIDWSSIYDELTQIMLGWALPKLCSAGGEKKWEVETIIVYRFDFDWDFVSFEFL